MVQGAKMKQYIQTYDTYAIQLTPHNLEELASICFGSKETSLDNGLPCIDFWKDGYEYRLEIGEWLIKETCNNLKSSFSIMLDAEFKESYKEL